MKFFKENWFVFFLLLIILFTRIPLLNKDAAEFWADERHYRQLITKLEEADKKGDFKIAYQTIFRLNARPALGLFYFPSAYLEWKNPGIPFGSYFNIAINFFSLLLVFLIIRKTKGERAAFFATFIIAFSLSSVIYIRHLLSYDIALFVILFSVYIHLKFKNFFIPGVLIGLSFLTYPGYYYYLMPIPFLVAFYYRSIRKTALFFIGIGAILLLTQFAYVSSGETTSYFKSLKDESSGGATENYGEFIPAAFYIGDYVLNVDGSWNLLLLLFILPGIFLIKGEKKLKYLFLYVLSAFLILEMYSHVLQKNVLFGRTARPFYLSSLVLSALFIEQILSSFKNKKIYMIGIIILVSVTLLNWWPRFTTYKNLVYPETFQKQTKEYLSKSLQTYNVEDAIFVNYWDEGQQVPENFFHPEKGENGVFYIMNAVQMFPYYGNYEMNRFCNHEVVLKSLHIQAIFTPYLFEGHKKIMREKMKNDPLYYQLIYCK